MSDIIGFEACKAELKRLFDEIAAHMEAAGANGPAAVHEALLKESKKLVDYTNRSEPENLSDPVEVENVRKLDELADDARRQLFGDSAREIISRIQDRSSQLNQLGKSVSQQTAVNAQGAGKARLIPLRNAIDAATASVNSIRQAGSTLSDDNATEAAVKADIEAVLSALAALQDSARNL